VALFKSAIVLKGGEVVSLTTSDSHEDIIEYLGLKDEGKKRTWCRVEFTPNSIKDIWNVDKYQLRLDETYIENLEWYEDIKEKVLEKMKVLASRQLITTRVRRLGYGIFYLGKGAEVAYIDHCRIQEMSDAVVTNELKDSQIIDAFNSSIYQASGCCFTRVRKTRIDRLTQCFVESLEAESHIGRVTRSYLVKVGAGTQIDDFDTMGYGSYLGVLDGKVSSSGSNSMIWSSSRGASHLGRAKTSQYYSDQEAINDRLNKHILELEAKIVESGGKKPRKPRVKKATVPLWGPEKFGLPAGTPEQVGHDKHPTCLVCKKGWTYHNGFKCKNPITSEYDIP
jgi:hypothetical protein